MSSIRQPENKKLLKKRGKKNYPDGPFDLMIEIMTRTHNDVDDNFFLNSNVLVVPQMMMMIDADGAGAAMEKEKMMEESFILKNQSLLKWHFLTC